MMGFGDTSEVSPRKAGRHFTCNTPSSSGVDHELRQPVDPSNTWNGEYWDDLSEKVFQGV